MTGRPGFRLTPLIASRFTLRGSDIIVLVQQGTDPGFNPASRQDPPPCPWCGTSIAEVTGH